MNEIGSRARRLPAPPAIVWRSFVAPDEPRTRPWLRLLDDEVAPQVLEAHDNVLLFADLRYSYGP